MQDEEIKERIAGFPHCHYQFDLKGNLTPIFKKTHLKRHAQRKKHFFDPFVGLFGGSLKGKRNSDAMRGSGRYALSRPDAITY
jgi:hypothetical protein